MGIHYHRHVHHHYNFGDEKTLERILSTLNQIRGKDMADLKTAFANLQMAVAKQETVDASVLTLLSGLRAQLAEMAQQETIDPNDVQALVDKLAKEQNSLSYAVTAGTGTPAAPGTPANPIPQTPIVAPVQQTPDGNPAGVQADAGAVQDPLVTNKPSTEPPSTDSVTAEAPAKDEQAQQAGTEPVDGVQGQAVEADQGETTQEATSEEPASIAG